jgi:Resolvase, N terminal domain
MDRSRITQRQVIHRLNSPSGHVKGSGTCGRVDDGSRASLFPHLLLMLLLQHLVGRNSIDVQQTVKNFGEVGVRVHCLALGGTDLTSSAGKMTMGVIAAVAQFERDLLIERTFAGQSRARSEGKKFGRPRALTEKQRECVAQKLANGATVSELARQLKVSRASVMRARAAA